MYYSISDIVFRKYQIGHVLRCCQEFNSTFFSLVFLFLFFFQSDLTERNCEFKLKLLNVANELSAVSIRHHFSYFVHLLNGFTNYAYHLKWNIIFLWLFERFWIKISFCCCCYLNAFCLFTQMKDKWYKFGGV